MLDDPPSKVWFERIAIFSVSAGVVLTIVAVSDGSLRAENEAEAAICRDMAGEVLTGEASRFDYMATRCPAELLMPVEGA